MSLTQVGGHAGALVFMIGTLADGGRFSGGCVFRSKVATRFGLKVAGFLAAAETGSRHVPK